MSNIEYAKEILSYYEKLNFKFKSRLMTSDYKVNVTTKTVLKFFKTEMREVVISEELANQISSQYRVRDYVSKLRNYKKKCLETEKGILMFTHQVPPNLEQASFADKLIKTSNNILNTYRKELDTPEFDAQVDEFSKILKNNVLLEEIGDYGVVFSHIVKDINNTPEIDKEYDRFYNYFNDFVKNNKQVEVEQKIKDEKELGK